jgi:hypothetical protein
MKKAYSPKGYPIRGTLETVKGVADLDDLQPEHLIRTPEGWADLPYAGGTDIWWDEQHTIERDGKLVFVDTEGYEWTEDEIIWKEEA